MCEGLRECDGALALGTVGQPHRYRDRHRIRAIEIISEPNLSNLHSGTTLQIETVA